MFDQSTVDAVKGIAERLNVPATRLLAVAEVESGGKATAPVNGKQEPLIRWEGHYFHRLLSGSKRTAAVKAGLASPKAGAVPNPPSQAARYAMLDRALMIDAEAALSSCSWGVGQVMGEHWRKLGFSSAADLVSTARKDVAGQVEIMARFIERFHLVKALRDGDWKAFAHGYNGPAYAKNRYDAKMAQAAGRWQKKLAAQPGAETTPAPPKAAPAETPTAEMAMKLGDKGDLVAELQRNLNALGMGPVKVDGVFGDVTRKAVEAFQATHEDEAGVPLKVDGLAGPRTMKAIASALLAPKIEEAEKNIPPIATKEVEKKTGLIDKLSGGLAALGLGASGVLQQAFGADWKTVVAIGGVLVIGGLIAFGVSRFLRRDLTASFRQINQEARQ